MRSQDSINAPEALVLTMVLVSAADGGMTDREIGVMSALVQTLPAFQGFTTSELTGVTDRAVSLLHEDDGLAHAGRLMRAALNPKLRETAYFLGCEVVAGGDGAQRQSLDMLEFVRGELKLDTLISTAIERGVRARYQRVDPAD
ncbi:tellurite resistance TerB family protein [Acidisphaera sp. S103]|uniref:tellurite resistance TerB family protein n=1 Tax=Acidisphaera sp. S103 TaxID=1747223 RepID=UPI00131AF557|nr:tellurite resistance TerB family protein [Acidisphaera sp. S103]